MDTTYLWQLGITGFLGVSVFLLVWSLLRVPVEAQLPAHRRFASEVGAQQRATVFEHAMFGPVMNLFLQLARRIPLPGMHSIIGRDLDAAGNPSGYSQEEYFAICLTCALATGAGVAVMSLLLGIGMNLLVVLIGTMVGFGIPLWALHQTAGARMVRIGRQLPYTLDLIALMMAAGSSFTEAVQTIIRDEPEDDLNQELQIVLAEIEFGAKRATALENMARRIPLDALRSVVGAVNQAESLGTPLAQILKNQSDMLRMYRSVRAEKLAASASLRIMFPSMLILLAVVMFVFGPIIIRWSSGGLMM